MGGKTVVKIALIGGGPTALFVYKRLLESERDDLKVEIFERDERLGAGMPYGRRGTGPEHITNVSSSELPSLPISLADWIHNLSQEQLKTYGLNRNEFDEDLVVPRCLFGDYLESQFQALLESATFETKVHLNSRVVDIQDCPESDEIEVVLPDRKVRFDHVVICSGHRWLRDQEGKVEGYFDSPYPPEKLRLKVNHPVALRGSSLTAVDAIRTLARNNGKFIQHDDESISYEVAEGSENFRLVMHSREGLLPCVRFHLEDPQVSDEGLLAPRDWLKTRESNDGFVPLDLFFEEDFKHQLADKDPDLYRRMKDLSLEKFVETALESRERRDPFDLFEEEYRQACQSVRDGESIHWKEALSVLSFALNLPAKHFSAEDSLRLSEVLAPLISVVIAFLPHSSVKELLALYRAGRLSLIEVGSKSEVKIEEPGIRYCYQDSRGESVAERYLTYVDCVGQPALGLEKFPFPSLVEQRVVRPARLRFRDSAAAKRKKTESPKLVEQDSDGSYHLIVPGIGINDNYRPLNAEGQVNERLSILAVPYIGGHNPDYSGLDFCEKASELVVQGILNRAEPAPFSGSAGRK